MCMCMKMQCVVSDEYYTVYSLHFTLSSVFTECSAAQFAEQWRGLFSSYTPCPPLMSHVTTSHVFPPHLMPHMSHVSCKSSSHASHVPCHANSYPLHHMLHMMLVTQMLHISYVTSRKLKSTIPRCYARICSSDFDVFESYAAKCQILDLQYDLN